jgi:hypothetical protein
MEATPWNRKSLLGSFEESPSLLLSALVFVFDLALFGAGSARCAEAGRHAHRHGRHRPLVPGRS